MIFPKSALVHRFELVVIHNAKQFVHNGFAFCGSILHKIVKKQQFLLSIFFLDF